MYIKMKKIAFLVSSGVILSVGGVNASANNELALNVEPGVIETGDIENNIDFINESVIDNPITIQPFANFLGIDDKYTY